MKKKMVTICLVVALVLTAVAGGTLAYFTDDEAKTNTFTVGNVDIEIEEQMIDKDGEWVPYDPAQKLSPIAQSKAPFNKMVITENTGSEPAYIRTFVTCPKDMYDYLGLGFNKQANDVAEGIHSLTKWSDVGTFMINGEETSVFLCEYEGVVEAGDSVLSLTKVWLYSNVTNDIVEDFELANGAFDVKVASQAIQSENLSYEEAMKELGAIDQTLMNKLFN